LAKWFKKIQYSYRLSKCVHAKIVVYSNR